MDSVEFEPLWVSNDSGLSEKLVIFQNVLSIGIRRSTLGNLKMLCTFHRKIILFWFDHAHSELNVNKLKFHQIKSSLPIKCEIKNLPSRRQEKSSFG